MIVCLGWGSLIWNPNGLVISGQWQPNGPSVPVEYLRQSNNGRLTLVIDKTAPKSTALWARMQTVNLADAMENLRLREGNTRIEYIGCWRYADPEPEAIPGLARWAATINARAVIWTALPARFAGEDFRRPGYNEALQYLRALPQDIKTIAEAYVRRTPAQIRTPYRDKIETDLGWKPVVEP
jgi:hypothetical protein